MKAATLLNAAVEVAESADAPTSPDEARRLLAAIHDADEALDRLHRAAGCVAPLDRHGRCTDCGRQVARHGVNPHRRRGCVTVIPFIRANLIFSIPLFGKALWLIRNRSQAITSPVGGPAGVSPSLPRIRRYRGTGTTTHEEVR